MVFYGNKNEIGKIERKEKVKIHSPLSKTEYLKKLKETTQEYNVTNTYATNSFLSTITEDKIVVYHTGEIGGGFETFEGSIEDTRDGCVISGDFVQAKYVRYMVIAFMIALWCGIIWFVSGAWHMLFVVVPIGIAFSAIILAFFKAKDPIERKEIIEFLNNIEV